MTKAQDRPITPATVSDKTPVDPNTLTGPVLQRLAGGALLIQPEPLPGSAPEPGTDGQPTRTVNNRERRDNGTGVPTPSRDMQSFQTRAVLPPDRRFQERPRSNRPVESPESIRLREDTERAVAEAAERRGRAAVHKARKWVKIGLQPAAGGYVLHVEHYEGDNKVKETIQRGLSPLAARERLALQMASLYSGL